MCMCAHSRACMLVLQMQDGFFLWGSGCIVAGEKSRKLGTAGLSLQGDTTEGELDGGLIGQKKKERGRSMQADRQAADGLF